MQKSDLYNQGWPISDEQFEEMILHRIEVMKAGEAMEMDGLEKALVEARFDYMYALAEQDASWTCESMFDGDPYFDAERVAKRKRAYEQLLGMQRFAMGKLRD
ncbi:hypothetical protein GAY28_00185 [Azospirillum brasilense]|nr:hypothetical protein [Azospirillum brasilense]